MVSKWSQEERRRWRAEQAAQISAMDYETLEIMRQLRLHVGRHDFPESPRAAASHAVWTAIERWAEVVTGDPEYFWHVRNGSGGS